MAGETQQYGTADKAAPGSKVLGLLSTPTGKEASIIRPFKGCVARKFSWSRESSGPHRESERVWSYGGQQTVGVGSWHRSKSHRLTQSQHLRAPPSLPPHPPHGPSSLHASSFSPHPTPPIPFTPYVTTTPQPHLLSTQLYCLVEHSPDDSLGTGGCGERPLISEVAAEVRGQQCRYVQSWDPGL